jgi:hypothetical protein
MGYEVDRIPIPIPVATTMSIYDASGNGEASRTDLIGRHRQGRRDRAGGFLYRSRSASPFAPAFMKEARFRDRRRMGTLKIMVATRNA